MNVSIVLYLLWIFTLRNGNASWSLEGRADGKSRLLFHNTTVVEEGTFCLWTWPDNIGGIWETHLRISFNGDRRKNGHLEYRKNNGVGVLHVAWHESTIRNLTWRVLRAETLPFASWNLSTYFTDWGYKAEPGSNVFYVNGKQIDLKITPASEKGLIDDEDIVVRRRKRNGSFNIIDLFTGNGIFAKIPQILIDIYGFLSGLFSPEDSADYESGPSNAEKIEPEAETVVKITKNA